MPTTWSALTAASLASLALASPASAELDFIAKWGSYGSGAGAAEGEFSYPRGIATDSAGNVYVVDRENQRVQKFDSSGNFELMWGKGVQNAAPIPQVCTSGCRGGATGDGQGEFRYPEDVAVDALDNVYVSEGGINDRIQKFDHNGAFLDEWGLTSRSPEGLAFGPTGNLILKAFPLIMEFEPDGDFVRQFGGGVKNNDPTEEGIFTGGWGVTTDPAGNVYATDGSGDVQRVQKFGPSGIFLSLWGTGGSGDGQFVGPKGLELLPSGNGIYVADAANDRVQVFTLSGAFLTKWGSEGNGDGQFQHPYDIATDAAANVYVTDTGNHRIQKFTGLGQEPGPGPDTTPDSGAGPAPAAGTAGNSFAIGSAKSSSKGDVVLTLEVPGPGKVEVLATANLPTAQISKGKRKGRKKIVVSRASASPSAAGTVKLTLKPRGKAKKYLKRKRRLRASAKITYTPTGASPSSQTRNVTFKAAKKKKKPRARR